MKFNVSVVKQGKPTKEIINKQTNTNFFNKFSNKLSNGISTLKEANRKQTEINKLIDKWLEIMANCNAYNSEMKTFTLHKLIEENYGYSCDIYVPYGMNFDKLTALKNTIQDGLACTFLFQQKKDKNYVKAKFITNGFKVGNYFPVKVNPYEVYIGNGCDSNPTIVSMLDFPHILLSGANGSGKTKCLDCMLTTLIHHCPKEELELYLVQVAKSDLVIYEDAEQTKAFADTLEKTNKVLDYVLNEMQKRDSVIRPLKKSGKGSNIKDYNELNPDNKLSFCYVVFDEMSTLFDIAGNDNEVVKLKKSIINKLEQIWQYGRALGTYGIACTQRPTADKLSPYVKSQSNLMISFKQNNQKSSEVAIGDPNIALYLEQRIAAYLTFDYDFLKTPFITDPMIIKFIKHRLKPYHKNILTEESTENKNVNKKSDSTQQVNKPIKNNGKIKA